jgi:tRNA threonylcarbamoyladenosine biosynthesis protein TsaB
VAVAAPIAIMTVLVVDTASPRPAVALHTSGRLFEEPLAGDRRASEELLPAIRRVLAASGLELAACTRIGVCAGPGSFTGLRVGLATAWGLGRAGGIPVEAVSTLEAMAEAARALGAVRVVAVLDAGRGDVVCERFDLGASRARSLAPPALVRADGVARFAASDTVVALPEGLAVPPAPALPSSPAAALAAAIARGPRGEEPARPLVAIYSRPSAAEEKHGAA